MKKRLALIFTLCIILTLGLGACSKNDKEIKDAGNDTNTDVSSSSDEATTKIEGEITVLTFEYADGNQYIDTLDQLKEEFEKAHEGVTVTYENFPYGEYENQLRLSLASGSPADIVWLDAPYIASYASSGALTELNDFWAQEDFEKLVDSAQSAMQYNNKIYAAPLNEAGICIYYNVEMMEAAGIQPPKNLEDQWTWDELYEVAKKLTKRGEDGAIEVYGISPTMGTPSDAGEGVAYSNIAWVMQAGGSVLNEDGSKAIGYFNSPETVEALKFYQKLHAEELAPMQGITNGFATGKVAMIVTGAWEDGYLSINFPEFKYDTTPLPKHTNSATPTGSWNVGIPAKSDNKATAWAFIETMINEEGSKLRCDKSGDVPAVRSVLEESERFSEPLFLPIKEEVLNNGKARPVSPVYPQISEALVKAFSDVAFGEDPQKTADKYATIMQEAIDK